MTATKPLLTSLLLIAPALVVLLGGCAAEPVPSASLTPAAISENQRNALAGGEIAWDEYQSTFEDYEACLAREGYKLADLRVDGDLIRFSVPGDAVDSGADERCYSYNWEQVDDSWQLAHEDTSPSAQLVADCLEKRGLEASEKYQQNLKRLDENSIPLSECRS